MRAMGDASAILHPEWMDVEGPDGTWTHGADQDWYPDPWQRRAGCGPTTASVILAYLARSRGELAGLCPLSDRTRAGFTQFMCQMWNFVTPVSHGLNQPRMMVDGMAAWARARGVDLSPALFPVPAARTKRLPFDQAAAFLTASLDRDCPVAFLNLHNGKVKELDRWHWVTIVALRGDVATLVDSGRRFDIDLALWYESSKKRGGFVSPLGVDPC